MANANVWTDLDRVLVEPDGVAAYVSYISVDVNNDDVNDLIITNADNSRRLAFTVVNDALQPLTGYDNKVAQLAYQASQNNEWVSLHYLGEFFGNPTDDILTTNPPIFATDISIGNNTFDGPLPAETDNLGRYKYMVFKHHVGDVKFLRQQTRTLGSIDDEEPAQVQYSSFALLERSQTKKMFRGYGDSEAAPIIVTEQFLQHQTPLPFSRWKAPEPVRTMTADERDITCHYYGAGQLRVLRSQWLATVETEVARRDYFEVVLTDKRTIIHATVCLAEGSVCASKEFVNHTQTDVDENFINNYDFYGDNLEALFTDHLPEIMCITAGDNGVELYLRYNSMEGTHYTIWREVGTTLVSVYDDYHYWFY